VTLPTVAATPEALQELPVPARSRLAPAEVVVPDGFRVEVVLAGLNMPCGMGVDGDGTGGHFQAPPTQRELFHTARLSPYSARPRGRRGSGRILDAVP